MRQRRGEFEFRCLLGGLGPRLTEIVRSFSLPERGGKVVRLRGRWRWRDRHRSLYRIIIFIFVEISVLQCYDTPHDIPHKPFTRYLRPQALSTPYSTSAQR